MGFFEELCDLIIYGAEPDGFGAVKKKIGKKPAWNLYKNAESGNTDAIIKLAEILKKESELEYALPWYEKAAEKNNNKALVFLYSYYKNQDKNKAMNCLRKALNNKYPKAYFYLGKMYFDGDGVNPSIEKALENFLLAVTQDDYFCMEYVGDCYKKVKKYKDAFQWYEKAARGNYALFQLGKCYQEGMGVSQNIEKAILFYEKDIQCNSFSNSKSELLKLYEKGYGGQKRMQRITQLRKAIKEEDELFDECARILKN